MVLKTLLISEDTPTVVCGTGQRLLIFKEALAGLGECRFLHLADGDRSADLLEDDFQAPIPFDWKASRLRWIWRRLSFAAYRPDRRYRAILAEIRKTYHYDLVLCITFRTSGVAPIGIVPCILDVDAAPDANGLLGRLLRRPTLVMMRRRARAFGLVYVIRLSDKRDLGCELEDRTRIMPGLSASVRQRPAEPGVRRTNILFVGATAWPPNRDAVEWLVACGLISALHARGYQLRLVGKGTENIAPQPGLSCGGFVPDIQAEYDAAEIVVSPMTSGTGANIKLIEAVQAGCPVVATAFSAAGFEGLLEAGVHLEVVNGLPQFKHAVLSLLGDTQRMANLSENTRAITLASLNKNALVKRIRSDVGKLMQQQLPS